MEKSKTSNRYSPEMRARAVRMVLEHQGSYCSQKTGTKPVQVHTPPETGCCGDRLNPPNTFPSDIPNA